MIDKTLPKAYIFGAGNVGTHILTFAEKNYNILGFLDNDSEKWGSHYKDLPIVDPNTVLKAEPDSFDKIIIASLAGVNLIKEQLAGLGVSYGKISTEYVDFQIKSRAVFLRNLAHIFKEQDIQGCLAECGVFQGDFASEINKAFPDKKLYLFDTFSGFDERDVALEQARQLSPAHVGHFNITGAEMVLSKMPNPEMCIVRKGYFPETTEGIDEVFCFVNLDFDLYHPTLSGLKYFYPRMEKGGVILIHDYFSVGWKGVKQAVDEFIQQFDEFRILPIGDGLSVAMQL